jgi:hypothetical protein
MMSYCLLQSGERRASLVWSLLNEQFEELSVQRPNLFGGNGKSIEVGTLNDERAGRNYLKASITHSVTIRPAPYIEGSKEVLHYKSITS